MPGSGEIPAGRRCRPSFPERQLLDRVHRRQVERTVEVGKERPAARRLPLQALAEAFGVDGEQHEILLPGIMLGERGFKLIGGGEVDEAVASVVG